MLALFRLRDKGLLSSAEYAQLASAYQFLRTMEHRLQMDEDRQTHNLPTDPKALEILARKLPSGASGEALTAATMTAKVNEHLASVRLMYERVIHAQRPLYYTIVPEPNASEDGEGGGTTVASTSSNLTRFLDQRAPQLAASVRVPAKRPRIRRKSLTQS